MTHWNAFLRVGDALKSNEPGLDPAWAAAMGVDKDALAVLRRVRRDVLPLVRDLERRKILRTFSFLVHDRTSGVPCPAEDTSAYVHLRLVTSGRADVRRLLPSAWVYVSSVRPTAEEERAQRILCEQSAWYLRLVEGASEMSDVDLLRHVGQTLHHFANMAQMMVR